MLLLTMKETLIAVIVSPFHNGPEVINFSVGYKAQNP